MFGNRIRRCALVLVLGILAFGFLAPARAEAWYWDSQVTLQGSAVCRSRPATYVWVEASNGEKGWATNGNGNYRFTFTRVPTGTMDVKVNYGNTGNHCTRTIKLGRPRVGTTATVNIVQLW